MNGLLEQMSDDSWGRLALHYLAAGGIQQFHLFLLVAVRLIGVFVVAPSGLVKSIPLLVRLGLALMLSLVIAPTISNEVKPDSLISQATYVSADDSTDSFSVLDLVIPLLSELALGTLLGFGVILVISGLRISGEWIDRQTGLGLGTVINPDWLDGEPATTSLVLQFGITALLTLSPISGDWLLLRSLIESFRAIPIGPVGGSTDSMGILNNLAQQSFILGIRVAMPLVLTMILVDLTLALSTRTSPFSLHSAWFAIRVATGLFVLSLTFNTIPEIVAGTTLQALRNLADLN